MPKRDRLTLPVDLLGVQHPKRRRYATIILHVGFWLLLLSLLLSFRLFSHPPGFEPLPAVFTVKAVAQFGLLAGLFYLNAYYLIPRYLFRRRTGLFVAGILLLVVALLGFNYALDPLLGTDEVFRRQMRERPPRESRSSPPDGTGPGRRPADRDGPPRRGPGGDRRAGPRLVDPFWLLSVVLVAGISTSLTVTLKWFNDADQQQSLEKERLSSELSLLKSQINPHFFFNTLNNIYALTEVNPTLAQEAIHRLSKLMRYVLYETELTVVPLAQEITFMKNYVELMKLRVTSRVEVQFIYPEVGSEWQIPPLLLIPFIENAFKHGVSYAEPSPIRVDLQMDGPTLGFQTRNQMFGQREKIEGEGSGIGLANVRRRLDLLFPGRHTLYAGERDNQYIIDLTIQLHENQVPDR